MLFRSFHLSHQTHHSLTVDRISLALEPDRHPPAPIERRPDILPVYRLVGDHYNPRIWNLDVNLTETTFVINLKSIVKLTANIPY